MPKTPSKNLFHLIKAMSASEKRYFKIYVRSGSGKESKYEQLFDAIDQQEAYNDEVLRKYIYNGEEIKSRKYSELKAYLYDLILKSLKNYDENLSVDFKLKGLLQSVRVLYKRSLFDACKQSLQKAKKLAYQFEAFLHILEIIRWEKQIAYAQMDVSFLDNQLSTLADEEKDCLDQLNNLSQYQDIYYQLLITTKKEAFLREKDKAEALKVMMANPLLVDYRLAQSHRARILFYRIYSNYYYSTLNYKGYYQTNKDLLDLMETKPYFLKEDVSEYISTLSNLTLSCGLLEKFEEVKLCLEKFHAIKPNTLDDELKIHRQYYGARFALIISTGEFEEGRKALAAHQKAVKKFDQTLFEKGGFYFQYFYIYFGIGDYDKALEYLNQWLNLPRSVARKDLQSIARILNLIIHYEIGNTILLENILRSTYRFLRQQNRLHGFEKEILEFIKESGEAYSKKGMRKAFVKLKQGFERLSKIPTENIIFQYFDFLSWLDSKIENRPFSEVVKEKYHSKTLV